MHDTANATADATTRHASSALLRLHQQQPQSSTHLVGRSGRGSSLASTSRVVGRAACAARIFSPSRRMLSCPSSPAAAPPPAAAAAAALSRCCSCCGCWLAAPARRGPRSILRSKPSSRSKGVRMPCRWSGREGEKLSGGSRQSPMCMLGTSPTACFPLSPATQHGHQHGLHITTLPHQADQAVSLRLHQAACRRRSSSTARRGVCALENVRLCQVKLHLLLLAFLLAAA